VEQMPTLTGGGTGYLEQVLGRAISRLVVWPVQLPRRLMLCPAP